MLILVVDDEESLCDLIAEILSEQHQIIKAYNGKEGLEVALQHQPDLIISDIMMPHMTGVELLKQLRSNPLTLQIPIILLSAAPPSADITGKASAFLSKPFEIDVLEKVVNAVAVAGTAGNGNYKNNKENAD